MQEINEKKGCRSENLALDEKARVEKKVLAKESKKLSKDNGIG